MGWYSVTRLATEEIIVSDVCYDLLDFSSVQPYLDYVLSYRDGRYVDVTREFPQLIRKQMDEAAFNFIMGEAGNYYNGKPKPYERIDEDTLVDATIWMTCAAMLGEESVEYKRMTSIASLEFNQWISENRGKIIESARNRYRVNYILEQ